jgi:hypothetical protein
MNPIQSNKSINQSIKSINLSDKMNPINQSINQNVINLSDKMNQRDKKGRRKIRPAKQQGSGL